MTMRNSILALPVLALISACDPISEEQCKGGNWAGIGLSDGKNGRSASVLDEYAATCGEIGISPVRADYLRGRSEGLVFYCTPANAYQIGREGGRINTVCTPEAQAAMVVPFNRGEDYHELSEAMDDKRDEINALQSRLSEFPATPDVNQTAEIASIKARIAELDRRIFRLSLERRRYARWP
jgi:hypothetical protein